MGAKMATVESLEITISAEQDTGAPADLIVRFPFGSSEKAELRIPGAILQSSDQEEWRDAIAVVRWVGQFLQEVQIPPLPTPESGRSQEP
jgi:hypothetical protein